MGGASLVNCLAAVAVAVTVAVTIPVAVMVAPVVTMAAAAMETVTDPEATTHSFSSTLMRFARSWRGQNSICVEDGGCDRGGAVQFM